MIPIYEILRLQDAMDFYSYIVAAKNLQRKLQECISK